MSLQRQIVLCVLSAGLSILALGEVCIAQQSAHELAFYFAVGGQHALITPSKDNRGFYGQPFVAHLQYQASTNGIQALSLFAEHVSETRTYEDLWPQPTPIGQTASNAHITEELYMTSLGLEMTRTIISESGFRLGLGVGAGGALGGATARGVPETSTPPSTKNSYYTWMGFLAEAFVRARYTVYHDDRYDIGIAAEGRYWGFPTIGPLGDVNDYNGPQLRSLHEVGYLVGISFGF